MKRAARIVFLSIGILILLGTTALLVVFPSDRISSISDFPTLSGPYLGEDLPGRNPVLFAPEIIGEDIHATVVFSSDGSEMYWRPFSEISDEILTMTLENGSWTQPRVVPFASRVSDSDDPFLTTDGGRMYFTSWRPPRWWKVIDQKERIWYVDRTEQGWSRPSPVSEAVNSMELHWQLSVSDDETLYFTSDEDLYQSDYQDGKHQQPERLESPINSPYSENHPWIAPDGSFLLFSSNRPNESRGDYDLYISWKSSLGAWGKPINLGDRINTASQELYPTLSPEQDFLFFLRARPNGLSVYWVDFEAILSDLMKEEAE